MSWDYDEFQEKRSSSYGGGGFSIFDVLDLSGGGGTEEQEFARLKEEYNRDSKSFFESLTLRNLYTEVTNKSVVEAWSQCMDANFNGLMVWYIGDPFDRYTVVLRYKDSVGSGKPIRISQVSFNYSQPIGRRYLKQGVVIRPRSEIVQTFLRTKKEEQESIAITFAALGVTLDLPFGQDPEISDIKQRVRRLEASLLQTTKKLQTAEAALAKHKAALHALDGCVKDFRYSWDNDKSPSPAGKTFPQGHSAEELSLLLNEPAFEGGDDNLLIFKRVEVRIE